MRTEEVLRDVLTGLAYIGLMGVTFTGLLSWSRRKQIGRWLRSSEGRGGVAFSLATWFAAAGASIWLLGGSWGDLPLAVAGTLPVALGMFGLSAGLRAFVHGNEGQNGTR